jgi:hypothetical protein
MSMWVPNPNIRLRNIQYILQSGWVYDIVRKVTLLCSALLYSASLCTTTEVLFCVTLHHHGGALLRHSAPPRRCCITPLCINREVLYSEFTFCSDVDVQAYTFCSDVEFMIFSIHVTLRRPLSVPGSMFSVYVSVSMSRSILSFYSVSMFRVYVFSHSASLYFAIFYSTNRGRRQGKIDGQSSANKTLTHLMEKSQRSVREGLC